VTTLDEEKRLFKPTSSVVNLTYDLRYYPIRFLLTRMLIVRGSVLDYHYRSSNIFPAIRIVSLIAEIRSEPRLKKWHPLLDHDFYFAMMGIDQALKCYPFEDGSKLTEAKKQGELLRHDIEKIGQEG